MKRGVYLINNPEQKSAFFGLILPEVLPRMEENNVFLIGAVEEDHAVGAAVMAVEAMGAELLSIAVTEGHRRQGIGSALLRQCVRVLRRISIQSLEALVLEDETEASALMEAFGMECSGEGAAHYEISLGAKELDVLLGKAACVVPLKEIQDYQYRNYMKKAFPAEGNLSNREAFEQNVSQVFVEDGQIVASLLAEKTEDGISLGWFSSWKKEPKVPMWLLRGALKEARERYPQEIKISFAAFEPSVIRLADKLLGNAVEKLEVRRWRLSDYRFRLKDTTPCGWEEA